MPIESDDKGAYFDEIAGGQLRRAGLAKIELDGERRKIPVFTIPLDAKPEDVKALIGDFKHSHIMKHGKSYGHGIFCVVITDMNIAFYNTHQAVLSRGANALKMSGYGDPRCGFRVTYFEDTDEFLCDENRLSETMTREFDISYIDQLAAFKSVQPVLADGCGIISINS